MRILKAVLTLLVLCCCAAAVMLIRGTTAQVTVSVETEGAQAHAETFAQVEDAVMNGTAERVFSGEPFAGAENYQLTDIAVTVKNPGFLPMEWLTCEYSAADGDVAIYEIDGLPADIPAHGEIGFHVRLIRRNGATDIGEMALTYYVLGREIGFMAH